METEIIGLKGKTFLHYIWEQEKIRRGELQQYYATAEGDDAGAEGSAATGGQGTKIRDKTRMRALAG